MTQNERLDFLINHLISEDNRYSNIVIPKDSEEKFNLFRSLVNVREPKQISNEFIKLQDDYLQERLTEINITDAYDLQAISNKLYLWQGDITTLKCGAIVNAANSAMLGCFVPCHKCIDNAIHTFSGVQLRLECNRIMKLQGHKEQTGAAKITKAYNLPCDYILHTVGPIVYGHLTDEHRKLLASCYRSCLELAEANGVKSIAFCCISTGEFHFPNDIAAQIAVETAKDYLKHSELERVIFNVLRIPTKKSTKNYSDKIIHLKEKLDKADAIVIGAGAGLSTAAGFTYASERFEKHFSDFKQKYGFSDMYSGGFYPFETLEEYWAY